MKPAPLPHPGPVQNIPGQHRRLREALVQIFGNRFGIGQHDPAIIDGRQIARWHDLLVIRRPIAALGWAILESDPLVSQKDPGFGAIKADGNGIMDHHRCGPVEICQKEPMPDQTIATREIDVIALLQALIRIPSADPPGGELAVAQLVHDTLAAAGIPAELDEFLPGRANVLGRVRGSGTAPALVFSSHMDTVPTGDLPWSFDPFAGDIVDDPLGGAPGARVRGRGATDMKSALAAFIAAAIALQHRETPLAGDVILAFTAGESANCLGAKRFLDQGLQPEIGGFLCGEPSGLDVVIVEKAILWLEARAEGQVGHVSGTGGVNAIQLMAGFLRDLDGLALDLAAHPLLSPPSINVGTITGGTAVNVTPDLCRAEIDIRFAPGIDPETVRARIASVAPPGIRLRITDFKPAVEARPDSPFVALCQRACAAETGRAAALRGVSYYSDGAILLDGIDVPFAIVGPGDLGSSGGVDETVSAENVRRAVRIYQRIAEDWFAL